MKVNQDTHSAFVPNLLLGLAGGIQYLKLKRASKNPRKSQEKTLRAILEYGKDTEYGKEHKFPYILEAKGDEECLCAERIKKLISEADNLIEIAKKLNDLITMTINDNDNIGMLPTIYKSIRIMEENQSIIAMGAGAISKMYYPAENRIERIPNSYAPVSYPAWKRVPCEKSPPSRYT